MVDRGITCMVNSIEPRNEPRETPEYSGAKAEKKIDKETYCVRSVIQDENH